MKLPPVPRAREGDRRRRREEEGPAARPEGEEDDPRGVLTQCLFPTMASKSRHRDAIDAVARESTRLVWEPRQFRDAVARHRYGEEREKILDRLGGSKAAPFPRDAVRRRSCSTRDRAAAKSARSSRTCRRLRFSTRSRTIWSVPASSSLSRRVDGVWGRAGLGLLFDFEPLRTRRGRRGVSTRSRRWRLTLINTGRAAGPATPAPLRLPRPASTGRRPEDLGLFSWRRRR